MTLDQQFDPSLTTFLEAVVKIKSIPSTLQSGHYGQHTKLPLQEFIHYTSRIERIYYKANVPLHSIPLSVCIADYVLGILVFY